MTPERITATLTTFGPNVDFVEPQNEYDSFAAKSDPDWTGKLIAAQKTLYNTVHGNPAFNGITVLGPALAHQGFTLDWARSISTKTPVIYIMRRVMTTRRRHAGAGLQNPCLDPRQHPDQANLDNGDGL
jgi:hypothetical protein